MGLKEILKVSGVQSDSGDRRKPNMIVIWIIIAALVLLAMSSFIEPGKEEEESGAGFVSTSDYAREQELRLEAVLKKISGAGSVSVFIELEDGGERVPARDEKSIAEDDGAEGGSRDEFESSVVMSDKGSASEPYVVKERLPQIAGVLVVASGAADESVRLKIYDSVKAVYGMSPHRIQVVY